MRLLDYECQTTSWNGFSIAERFGAETIKDTYRRARAGWKNDRVYGTELGVINYKCWCWYGRTDSRFSGLYAELWEEYHDWMLDNWKGENLAYYLRATD